MRNDGDNRTGSNGSSRREERGMPKEADNVRPRCLRRAPVNCRRKTFSL